MHFSSEAQKPLITLKQCKVTRVAKVREHITNTSLPCLMHYTVDISAVVRDTRCIAL